MKRLLLYSILLTPVSFALTIANYTPETNDRFANDTDFVGDAFDFSGVARVQIITLSQQTTLTRQLVQTLPFTRQMMLQDLHLLTMLLEELLSQEPISGLVTSLMK